MFTLNIQSRPSPVTAVRRFSTWGTTTACSATNATGPCPPPLPSEERTTQKVLRACICKQRTGSGLDCLACAMFTRQWTTGPLLPPTDGSVPPTAPERREDNSKGIEGLYLQAKDRIWP